MMFAPGPLELLIVGLLCAACVGIPAVVLIVVLLNRKSNNGTTHEYGRIACPECGQSIAAEAIKCRYCGTSLVDDSADT